jgi:hypothetical protein
MEQEQPQFSPVSGVRGASLRARERLRAARGVHRLTIIEFVRWAITIVIALIVALLIALYFLDWNKMRGPISDYISARLGRPFAINGDLHVHLFSFTPSVSAQGVIIGNPSWLQRPHAADAQSFVFTFRLLPLLFGGTWELPLVAVDHPDILIVRKKDGRTNWDFNGETGSSDAFKLPPLQHFIINDGHLEIHDLRRNMTFDGTLSSHEGGRGGAGFALNGKGLLNERPFTVVVNGGPLIHVDVTKPYAFDADVHAGPTHVTAKGSITHPFDLGGIEAAITASGPTMSQLYYLTGLAWPNTPPYSLRSHLERNGAIYKLTGMRGTVGDSDLEGHLTVNATGKADMTGAISSRVLDFDDLGPLLGAPPPAKERAKALAAGATPAQVAPMAHLLPDMPLQMDRIRQMNADIRYSAKAVKSRDFPLRRATAHVVLKDGVLTLDPLSFTFVHGKLAGMVRIDARRNVPATDIDARLSDIRLEQFVSSKPPAIEGLFVARARLHGTGVSILKTAQTASGTVAAVIPHGKMRAAFAELTGINVLNGVGLLLSGDKSDTNVRCAVASFNARGGVLTSQQLLLDTEPVLVTGHGTAALDGQSMNFTIEGEPKKFRLFHVHAPITITGPVDNPKIGIDVAKALPQGGFALALGLLSPIAAILPFVDPGLATNADCRAVIGEAEAHAAAAHTPAHR